MVRCLSLKEQFCVPGINVFEIFGEESRLLNLFRA